MRNYRPKSGAVLVLQGAGFMPPSLQRGARIQDWRERLGDTSRLATAPTDPTPPAERGQRRSLFCSR